MVVRRGGKAGERTVARWTREVVRGHQSRCHGQGSVGSDCETSPRLPTRFLFGWTTASETSTQTMLGASLIQDPRQPSEKPKDDLGRFEKEVTSAVSIKTQNDDRRRSPDVSFQSHWRSF